MTEDDGEPLRRRSKQRQIAADRVYARQPAIAQPRSRSQGGRPNPAAGSQWAKLLRYLHGLRPEQWQAMFAEQDGRCYLCKRPLPADRQKIAIDHDHSCTCGPRGSCSYCRRGLACSNCNSGVGMFGDDPQLMRLAAANLERAQAITKALMITKPVQGELIERDA